MVDRGSQGWRGYMPQAYESADPVTGRRVWHVEPGIHMGPVRTLQKPANDMDTGFRDGIKAIAKLRSGGTISEHRAHDLLAALTTAYVSAKVTQQVEIQLNRGLARIFGQRSAQRRSGGES